MLTNLQKSFLLDLAKKSIHNFLNNDIEIPPCPDDAIFSQKAACFVTLHKNGKLRGCIGYIKPVYSLYNTVKKMAIAAAFEDPRFNNLKLEELPFIEIEISILSNFEYIDDISQIIIGKHGLIIENPYGHGLLLPQVASEYNWTVKQFLQNCCLKAGLDNLAYTKPETKIQIFTAEIFNEV